MPSDDKFASLQTQLHDLDQKMLAMKVVIEATVAHILSRSANAEKEVRVIYDRVGAIFDADDANVENMPSPIKEAAGMYHASVKDRALDVVRRIEKAVTRNH